MIKGLIQQEDIIIKKHRNFKCQLHKAITDIKAEIESNTTGGDFNTPVTSMDRSCR